MAAASDPAQKLLLVTFGLQTNVTFSRSNREMQFGRCVVLKGVASGLSLVIVGKHRSRPAWCSAACSRCCTTCTTQHKVKSQSFRRRSSGLSGSGSNQVPLISMPQRCPNLPKPVSSPCVQPWVVTTFPLKIGRTVVLWKRQHLQGLDVQGHPVLLC